MELRYEGIVGSGEIQLDVLRAICGDTSGKSFVDIGCGFAPQTRLLGFAERLYVDIVKRDLAEENDNFLEMDTKELVKTNFPSKTDVSISLDNLEHYWKEDGERLIEWMQNNSHKQIIFTPEGRYMNVSDTNDNHPDTHKHSWTASDFQKMGWATILFPNFHPGLGEGGLGAFFAINCENLAEEFERIKSELKNKLWAK